MTSSLRAVPEAPADDETPAQEPSTRSTRRFVPPLTMILVIVVAASAPLAFNRSFYFWDDSAAIGVPALRVIGESVLDGRLPLFEPTMWRGGNLIGEGALGVLNPLMLLNGVIVSQLGDLAVAAAFVKIQFLVIMGLGSYLLARSYGVRPWLAATVGACLPLSGYTLFMDATSWLAALAASALFPWAWWSLRDALQGRRSPWIAFAIGGLCVTLGNPYSLFAWSVAFAAVVVEAVVTKRPDILRIGGRIAVSVFLLVPIVYLPLYWTLAVSYRQGSGLTNTGFMVPGLGDVLNISSASFQPHVDIFGWTRLDFPGTYVAWFVVPTLPFLRWRVNWRAITAALVLAGFFLLAALGPSQAGMLRWPLRLLPYLWVPVMVIWAFLAEQGFRRPTWTRAAVSAALVAAGAYLAFAAEPERLVRHGLVALATLGLLAVWAIAEPRRRGVAVLIGGVALFVGVQSYWFQDNSNVATYDFPTSIEQIRADFADVTPPVFAVAGGPLFRLPPEERYDSVLLGDMWAVAGLESPNAYSGIGFNEADEATCIGYYGGTCDNAWNALWTIDPTTGATMADLLRINTVVADRASVPGAASEVPAGWSLDESDPDTFELRRLEPLPSGDDRVSWSSVGLTTDTIDSTERRDRVSVSNPTDAPGSVLFARLDWPGYRATVDGDAVAVRTGPIGLVEVEVPAGASGELSLDWRPPGWRFGLLCATAALVIMGAGSFADRRRLRRVPQPS